MFSERFICLLTKELSGTLTPPEASELEALLQNPVLATRYKALQQFFAGPRVPVPDTEAAMQKVLSSITGDMPAAKPRSKRLRPVVWLGITLAGVVLAGGLWLAQNNNRPGAVLAGAIAADAKKGLLEKQNEKGIRSVIILADGSKVWLNADSKLYYPATFDGDTREINLSGEAFFEIARNPKKPFIIHLASGTVRVLGTSFNVKAYPGENKIETSVATGKVAFIPKGGKAGDTTFLTQNLKAVYTVSKGLVQTVSTSASEDKEWTEGKLTFDSASMAEIAVQLERYFGKQVVVNDEEIYGFHLTGSFENDSAEEILYYLSKLKPFTYRITETQIILSLVR